VTVDNAGSQVTVMPAHAGIHVFASPKQGVDDRDKPGHDRGT
jgi:hypothetical protein